MPEPLEGQGLGGVSAGCPAAQLLEDFSTPLSWQVTSFQPLQHFPKHLLALSVSTCIKLNVLFSTFSLPVAGPLLGTEAHHPSSLSSSHKSAEQCCTYNLITGKQNQYLFSSNAAKMKHYFYWAYRRQLMLAFGCRAPSPGFKKILYGIRNSSFSKYLRNKAVINILEKYQFIGLNPCVILYF